MPLDSDPAQEPAEDVVTTGFRLQPVPLLEPARGEQIHTGPSPLAPEWLEVPQDWTSLDPAIWPEQFGRDGEGTLTVSGIPTITLAEHYGTALYVVSEDAFRQRAAEFRTAFQDAFAAVWAGEAESDGFNALVVAAGLSWRQAMVLRSYPNYLRQARTTFSQ